MNFDQTSEILSLHFCARLKLQIECRKGLKIIYFSPIEMSSMCGNCIFFKFHDVTLAQILDLVFIFALNYCQTASVFILGGHCNREEKNLEQLVSAYTRKSLLDFWPSLLKQPIKFVLFCYFNLSGRDSAVLFFCINGFPSLKNLYKFGILKYCILYLPNKPKFSQNDT